MGQTGRTPVPHAHRKEDSQPYDLLDEPLPYKTYGGKFIETLAKQQMNLGHEAPHHALPGH